MTESDSHWTWRTRRLHEALAKLLKATEGAGGLPRAQLEATRVLRMLGEPPMESGSKVESPTLLGGHNVGRGAR